MASHTEVTRFTGAADVYDVTTTESEFVRDLRDALRRHGRPSASSRLRRIVSGDVVFEDSDVERRVFCEAIGVPRVVRSLLEIPVSRQKVPYHVFPSSTRDLREAAWVERTCFREGQLTRVFEEAWPCTAVGPAGKTFRVFSVISSGARAPSGRGRGPALAARTS